MRANPGRGVFLILLESIRMNFEVIAEKRVEEGTGASRRLRRAGSIPAIIYGGQADPVSIKLVHKDIYRQLQEEAFHSSILTLNVDGKKELAVLRAVQYHSFKPAVLHVDFQRVDANEKLHLKVPVHFVNEEKSPGVHIGGIVHHIVTELDVLCLPKDLPEAITVDLAQLEAGHSIHLADIQLPAGVESVALNHGDNQALVAIEAPNVAE